MEKNILNEINDIRRIMSLPLIYEENLVIDLPLLIEGVIEQILRDVMGAASRSVIKTVLSEEERQLIKRFFNKEIKTIDEKIKFSDFAKSTHGYTAISELRDAVKLARENGRISVLGQKYWNTLLKKMEKSETNWSKEVLDPHAKVLDVKWGDLYGLTTDEVVALNKKRGIINKFLSSVTNMFKRESELLEETLQLFKQLQKDTGSSNIETYKQNISDNFLKLTKIRKDNFNSINDWIRNNVPQKVQSRLNRKGLTGYELAKQLSDGTSKVEFDKKWGDFKLRKKEFWNGVWDLLGILRSKGERVERRFGEKGTMREKGLNLFGRTSKEGGRQGRINFDELRWDFYLGTMKSSAAWKEYIKVFGLKAAGIKYAKEYAYVWFLMNTIMTFFDWISDVIGNRVKGVDYWWFREQARQYDEKYFDAYGYKKGSKEDIEDRQDAANWDAIRKFKDTFGIIMQSTDENFLSIEGAIPGFLDNFALWLNDVIFMANHAQSITPDKVKEVVDKGNELKQRGGVIIDTVGNKIKKEIGDTKDDIQRKSDSIATLPIENPNKPKVTTTITPADDADRKNLGL